MFEITIPVLNEEDTLKINVIKAISYIKEEVTEKFRIIIVDNGSSDNTEIIAKTLCEEFDEVRFIKVSKKGVGLALRTSWLNSNAEYVGYMDLDLATDLFHLKEIHDKLIIKKECEIINGSRLLKGSKVIGRKISREITSRLLNTIVKFYLGVEISDCMCGFKFFKKNTVVSIINSGANIDSWFFSAEILIKSSWLKKNIIEIPIKWTDDKHSKVNIKKLSLEYLKHIIRLKREHKKYLIDYS